MKFVKMVIDGKTNTESDINTVSYDKREVNTARGDDNSGMAGLEAA